MSQRERRDPPDRPDRPDRRGPAAGAPAAGGRGRPPAGRDADRSARGGRGRGAERAGRPAGADRAGDARPSTRPQEPPLPDEVTGRELDRAVRDQLSSLAAMNSDTVARHLVMAGLLLDEDPETAYQHAAAAAARAGRVGAVREAAGLAAYRSGRYAEALSELRAARRISGDNSLLPVMADAERGLGRPERALELATSSEAGSLDAAGRVELAIVVSGARRDLGQPGAAVLALQDLVRGMRTRRPWSARLLYAYADALLDADRRDEAISWFEKADAADESDETDADVRLAELSGVTFLDDESDADDG